MAICWSSVASGKQVAGDLLDRELVERHVGVQGADDPVAIGPDRAVAVALVAVGVGIAGRVEPGGRPALAVVRRGQQSIDQALVGVGRSIGEECIDLGDARRQADQIERNAADQTLAVGWRRGARPSFSRRARTNESIGIARPGCVAHSGQRRRLRRDIGPVLLDFRGFRADSLWPLGSLIDPGAHQADLLIAQRVVLKRHSLFSAQADDAGNQQAFGALAGRQQKARLAAAHHDRLGIQPQLPLLLILAVAVVTPLGKDRLDIADEIDRAIGGGGQARLLDRLGGQRDARQRASRAIAADIGGIFRGQAQDRE